MILGDILVIWRIGAVWYDRPVLVTIPLFWWGSMISEWIPVMDETGLNCLFLKIVNLIVSLSHCRSGVSSTNYTEYCKVTDVLAPVLSIVTNMSVMMLTIWKAW